MDFDLNEDQALIFDAVNHVVSRHSSDPIAADYSLTSPDIERELVENGFLGSEDHTGLGPVEALLIATALGRLPFAIEAAASGLFGATLLSGLPAPPPRPLALALAPAKGPIRFLQDKGAALIVGQDDVRLVEVADGDVEKIDSLFSYPYGRFRKLNLDAATVLRDVSPDAAKQWWRVVIAAEIGSASRAALEATVEYVKQRRQFNRAIGSFQAVQHRLSHIATLIAGIEMLTKKAASTRSPADAAVAATFAQQNAGLIHYECTQFHGAMGLTLECPLHFWTYRIRALQGELRGLSEQAVAAAAELWPAAIAKQTQIAGPQSVSVHMAS